MKQIGFVLCADDYAMTPAISHAILALLDVGRITATGAMTNRPFWPAAAGSLRSFIGAADLGLHISLTCGAPLTRMPHFAPAGTFPKLKAVLGAGLTGRLPLTEIEAEIEAQIAAYEERMGRAPDFIDGHQHIHALPGVRRAFAAVLERRYWVRPPYLRNPADSYGAIVARQRHGAKAALLSALTQPFAARMRALGFTLNDGFSGYSGFAPEADYACDFKSYLIAPGARHLVMCHPGMVDAELRALDPAVESRAHEFAFFQSNRFPELCAEAGMTPCRFTA